MTAVCDCHDVITHGHPWDCPVYGPSRAETPQDASGSVMHPFTPPAPAKTLTVGSGAIQRHGWGIWRWV